MRKHISVILSLTMIFAGNFAYCKLPEIWKCEYITQDFVDRPEYLKSIKKKYLNNNVAVITGMGGLGKSQIAKKYASSYKNNYKIVFWINAQVDIEPQLLKLADEYAYNIDTQNKDYKNYSSKRKISYITNELRKSNNNWLLIFDNVINQQSIKKYIITSQGKAEGHILVTSRSQNWQNPIKVKTFSPNQSSLLINKVLKSSDTVQQQHLGKLLNYHPLAITRAVYLIKNGNTNIEKFLKEFNNRKIDLLHRINKIKGNVDDYFHTTYTITTMALSNIKKQSYQAWELLLFLSLLKNIDIPVKYINTWIKMFTKNRVSENILTIIQTQSILEQKKLGKTTLYNIHELSSEIIKHNIPKSKEEKYINQSIGVLLGVLKKRSDIVVKTIVKEPYHLEHAEKILKIIKKKKLSNPKINQLKVAVLECYMRGKRDFTKGEQLIKEIDSYYKSTKSSVFHSNVPTIEEAILYTHKGYLASGKHAQYKVAMKYCRVAINILNKLKKPYHDEFLRVVSWAAVAASLRGDIKNAEKFLEMGQDHFKYVKGNVNKATFLYAYLTKKVIAGERGSLLEVINNLKSFLPLVNDLPSSQMYYLSIIIEGYYRLGLWDKVQEMRKKTFCTDKKILWQQSTSFLSCRWSGLI